MMGVVKRIVALHAAETPEGFFEWVQREYDDGSCARAWGGRWTKSKLTHTAAVK